MDDEVRAALKPFHLKEGSSLGRSWSKLRPPKLFESNHLNS